MVTFLTPLSSLSSQRHDKRQSPLINNSSPNATPQPKANGCSPLNDVSSPLFSLVSTVTSNALQQQNSHNSTSSSPLLDFQQQAANLHSSQQSLVNSILQPQVGQAARPSPNSQLANSSPFLSQLASNLTGGGQQTLQSAALQQQLNTSNNSSLNNSLSNSHLNSSNNSNSSCNSSLNNQSQSGSALANSGMAASLLAANPALAAAFGKNLQNGLPWNLPNALSSVYNQALANAISGNAAAAAAANNPANNQALSNLNTLNSLNSLASSNSSTFGKLSTGSSNPPASSSANRNSPNNNNNSTALNSNNVNSSLAVAALVQQLGINPLNPGALGGMSLPNLANLSQVAQLGLNLSNLNSLNSLTNNLANSDLKSSNQSAFPFNLYSGTGLDLALAMAGAQASSSSANFNGNAASSKKLSQSSKHSLLNGNQTGSLFPNAFPSQLLQQQQQHLKQLADLGDGDRAKEDDLSAINCEGELPFFETFELDFVIFFNSFCQFFDFKSFSELS